MEIIKCYSLNVQLVGARKGIRTKKVAQVNFCNGSLKVGCLSWGQTLTLGMEESDIIKINDYATYNRKTPKRPSDCGCCQQGTWCTRHPARNRTCANMDWFQSLVFCVFKNKRLSRQWNWPWSCCLEVRKQFYLHHIEGSKHLCLWRCDIGFVVLNVGPSANCHQFAEIFNKDIISKRLLGQPADHINL